MANWWNALFMRTFRTSLRTCKFLHGLIAHRITIIETKFRMREEGLEEKSSDFMGAENTPDPIEQIEKDLYACISAGTTRKLAGLIVTMLQNSDAKLQQQKKALAKHAQRAEALLESDDIKSLRKARGCTVLECLRVRGCSVLAQGVVVS